MRVTVLCFNRVRSVSGKLPASEVLEGVLVRRIGFLDLTYYKPAAIPLYILKSHDVIHVHGIGAPLDYIAMTKWAHKRPIVLSTHGGIFHTSTLSGLKYVYFRTLARWAMQQVDEVAACSQGDAAVFSTVARRVTLVENAVAIQPLLALSAAHKQPGRCLYVGGLSENKGIDLLLRVAATARKKGAVFTLRLVGPDIQDKRPGYEALSARLGLSECVAFVGEVSREALLQEYEQADVFVSASRYEGFGLSAIEAKAAGCRLLLHRNEAFQHTFQSDTAATLVDFSEPEIAGAALADLLFSPRDVTQAESRRDAEAYSWEHKLSEWSALYHKVASGNPDAGMRASVGRAGDGW